MMLFLMEVVLLVQERAVSVLMLLLVVTLTLALCQQVGDREGSLLQQALVYWGLEVRAAQHPQEVQTVQVVLPLLLQQLAARVLTVLMVLVVLVTNFITTSKF
jgi:hypothetical protein